MAKVHVTIKFKESDHEIRFMAAKPGRYEPAYAERITDALEGLPNIGSPAVRECRDPGPGVIITLKKTRQTSQPNAKAEIQIALRKAGYKTFTDLPR